MCSGMRKDNTLVVGSVNLASCSPDWRTVDFAALGSLRDEIAKVVKSGDENSQNDIARVVAKALLERFSNPLEQNKNAFSSPAADVLIEVYGSHWGERSAARFESIIPAPMKSNEFTEYVQQITAVSHCSGTHPLFAFAAEEASRQDLAMLLAAENLCDLNFVHILAQLIPGSDGDAAAEIARNLWDEFGHGEVARFHRNMRLALMANVGLSSPEYPSDLSQYLSEEIEHFTAYALNGTIRRFSTRLLGMLYATEFLVPKQLTAIIVGWRRVGLADSHMQYLLDHCGGDVEHANGWANHVVVPCISASPALQREILVGVHQHIDILGRLYDRLYEAVTSRLSLGPIASWAPTSTSVLALSRYSG